MTSENQRRLHPQHRRSAMARISRSFWRRTVETAGDAGDGGLASPGLSDIDVSADGARRASQASGPGANLPRA